MKTIDKNICIRIDRNPIQIKRGAKFLKENHDFINNKSKFLGILGNNVRLSIMLLLQKENKLCVCDMAEMLEMKIPAISQHLRKMKDSFILESEREGTIIYYFISSKIKDESSLILKVNNL